METTELDKSTEDFEEDMMGYSAKELPKALVAAQTEFKNPKKDAMNPFFKKPYLSLGGLLDAVMPIFNKHGIAVIQDLGFYQGGVTCTTVLIHTSGETVSFGPFRIPVASDDPQHWGKAASYARRYAMQAVANIAAEDDDAEGTMDRSTTRTPPVSSPQSTEPEEVTTTVLNIEPKKGKFPYIIHTTDGEFRSYHDRVATEAQVAADTKAGFHFQYRTTRYGKEIVVDPKVMAELETK